MTDTGRDPRRAPDCVDTLLRRLDILARMLDYSDALAVYAFDPAFDDVRLCPALGQQLDVWERHTLDELLDDLQVALDAYRRQPGLSRSWAAGRLRAVVEQARRDLHFAKPDVIDKALQSPRCADCAHAAGCRQA